MFHLFTHLSILRSQKLHSELEAIKSKERLDRIYFLFILTAISEHHNFYSSPWRWIYWTATNGFIWNLHYVQCCVCSINHIVVCACVCAFKDHQCFPGTMKLFLTLPPQRPSLEFERSLVCIRKIKKHWGETRESAQPEWVGVVRYWFTIMVQVDPDAARRVHLCYQRWAILMEVYYDQVHFILFFDKDDKAEKK